MIMPNSVEYTILIWWNMFFIMTSWSWHAPHSTRVKDEGRWVRRFFDDSSPHNNPRQFDYYFMCRQRISNWFATTITTTSSSRKKFSALESIWCWRLCDCINLSYSWLHCRSQTSILPSRLCDVTVNWMCNSWQVDIKLECLCVCVCLLSIEILVYGNLSSLWLA